jgi:hypothetical protein
MSIIDDSRLELPFSLFGGKLTGVFRSRTAEESKCILGELYRQFNANEFTTPSEYSTVMRNALLLCQVKEINSVEYPVLSKPYKSVLEVVDGSKVVSKPKWCTDANVIFSEMHEGKTTALYKALQLFEQKYWTLIKHADDQDFWNPEDSTSA